MIEDPRECTVMGANHLFCGRPAAVKYVIKASPGTRTREDFPLYRCEEHRGLTPKYQRFDGPLPLDARISDKPDVK